MVVFYCLVCKDCYDGILCRYQEATRILFFLCISKVVRGMFFYLLTYHAIVSFASNLAGVMNTSWPLSPH